MKFISTLACCACIGAGAAQQPQQIPLNLHTDTCLPNACPINAPESAITNEPKEPPPPYRWTGPFQCAGPYCIYSNPGFASGQGLVVITTAPNIAILNRTTAPSPAPPNPSPAPFTIAPVPDKGLGILATTPLERGDPVLTIPAAFLVHRAFQESVPYATQTPLLDAAVLHLPPARREVFLSQMGHFGGHQIADILATNTFQLNIGGQDGHHFASFPEASRFNHDCRPNVAGRIEVDPERGSILHKTTVVREVKPGEELTITYLDSAEPRAKRIERTKAAWGFECGCAQCALPKKAVKASDARLAEMKKLEGRLADVEDKGVTVGMLRRVVRLYHEERLEVEMAGVLTLVALNYNMLGEDKLAAKYAKLAREAVLIEYGKGSGDAEAMRVLAEAPKEHFSWKARVGR